MVFSNDTFNEAYRESFMFGASYAPYALGEDIPEEEWEQDLLRMKEMGFNTVRVFAAWSRIESRKDQYDFRKVDYLFDLAQQNGIQVILNFGGLFESACGNYRPWYLNDVEVYCFDNPVVAERADLFMRRVIERYRSRENLVGWMIWNEPNNIPHCTCAHTTAYFRKWLKEKYGSIEKLNAAWSAGEPVLFESFEEIDSTVPHGGNNQTGSLDKERFQQWNLTRHMRKIHQMVLELDPKQRFTTGNMVYHLAATEGPHNSSTYGFNLEQLGEAQTMMGASCYTIEHRYDPQPAWKVSYKISRIRTASCDQHHRFLLLETGAGPNIQQLSPARRNALMWQLIAHNSKGLLMWNYRSRVDGGQVALHHMMAFDGSMTERAAAIASLNTVLQKNAALLNHIYPDPKAAVLTLEDSMLLQGINYPIGSIHSALDYDRVQESRFGAYKLLWDMKISADSLTEKHLSQLHRYNVLLLPAQEQITVELAAALKEYVAQGGTVIAEGPMGFRNRDGRLIYRAPGYGLDEVFGCYLNDRQRQHDAVRIQMPDGSKSPMCDFYSVLYPTTAEVICRYDGEGGLDMCEGNPGAALTVNHYGKGKVICAGTEIFRQYAVDPQEVMSALMKQQIWSSGILPDAVLEGETAHVEAVRLSGQDNQVLYILTNHSDRTAEIKVQVREKNAKLIEITNGTAYACSFAKCLLPWETLAVYLETKEK